MLTTIKSQPSGIKPGLSSHLFHDMNKNFFKCKFAVSFQIIYTFIPHLALLEIQYNKKT